MGNNMIIAFFFTLIECSVIGVSASLFIVYGLDGLIGERVLPIKSTWGYAGLFILGWLLVLAFIFS